MPTVVIGVGSNSDHKNNIRQALDNLQREFGNLLVSPVYQSAPADTQVSDEKIFATEVCYYLNLVVSFESSQAIASVKSCLRAIEQQQLRERNTDTVSIDLDLLLYGSWVGDLDTRKVPHEDIELCEFVLRPLAELLPDSVHPINGCTYRKLWEDVKPSLLLTPVAIDWV